MEMFFYIVGAFVLLAGLIGCVLPIIPGPPVAYIALLIRQFTMSEVYSPIFLFSMAILVVIVTVLDFVVPTWGTKKLGGTKYGTRGSTIGLIIGILFMPFGLVSIMLGPFVGAFIGESIGGMKPSKALISGIGAFVGFLAGTIMKLASTLLMAVFFFFPGIF